MRRCLQATLLFAISLLLTSCIGGGGGSTVAEGGIGGTGISMGRVTQIGSVYVNGVHYDTNAASFTIEGTSLDSQTGLQEIAVGMVVRVTGTKDDATSTGTAIEVDYDSLVIGSVDSAFSANSVGVMGQTVWTNTDTVFEGDASNPLISDLSPNDMVEVSGFSDGETGILATRIEVIPTPATYKVTGVATSVDPVQYSFHIGGLIIHADTIPSMLPTDGTYVEVTGDTAPTGSDFTALQIDTLGNGDGTLGDDGEEIEVEGQITLGLGQSPLASDQFVLNGQIVQLLASTTYKTGSELDLVADRLVEVEGTMQGTILLAGEIEVEAAEGSKEELAGTVTSVTPDGTGGGTIELLGQIVQVTNSTILESDLDGESTFTLSELEAGLSDTDQDNDYVEARVFTDTGGNLVATKLEREVPPGPDYAELEGVVTNLDTLSSTFVLAGVTVNYTNNTSSYTPQANDVVEVVGTYDSVADEVDGTNVTLSN